MLQTMYTTYFSGYREQLPRLSDVVGENGVDPRHCGCRGGSPGSERGNGTGNQLSSARSADRSGFKTDQIGCGGKPSAEGLDTHANLESAVLQRFHDLLDVSYLVQTNATR